MSPTLLLRLEAPLQAWGVESRFDVRDTRREPSKSGVIGLLCAALGKPRTESPGDGFPKLHDLARLRMGVRVDREGHVSMDYHTAGGTHRVDQPYGVRRASDKAGDTVVSRRYYLADASFLVGLEGQLSVLERLGMALRNPRWQLALGRKAFVPAVPVPLPASVAGSFSIVPLALEDALARTDWGEGAEERRAVIEMPHDRGESRQDVPLDFAMRRFAVRYVTTRLIRRQEDEECSSPSSF